MNYDPECSIVVSSCDNFSDVWSPFFKLFFKYWSDCPFKIYLISETKKFEDERVFMILLGEDKQWASNLKSALHKIDTPYFIYFQEDFFLQSKVDTKRILELLKIVKENKAAYMKLRPSPKPTRRFERYKDIGIIEKDAKYSISNQATLWKTEIYRDFLKDGDTGWDTELYGSRQSQIISEPFLSVYKDVIDYPQATAVKKGVLLYDAFLLCKREGIPIDKTKRKIESKLKYFLRVTKLLPIVQRLTLWRFPK